MRNGRYATDQPLEHLFCLDNLDEFRLFLFNFRLKREKSTVVVGKTYLTHDNITRGEAIRLRTKYHVYIHPWYFGWKELWKDWYNQQQSKKQEMSKKNVPADGPTEVQVKEAWNSGCSDVRKTLEKLYPSVLKAPPFTLGLKLYANSTVIVDGDKEIAWASTNDNVQQRALMVRSSCKPCCHQHNGNYYITFHNV